MNSKRRFEDRRKLSENIELLTEWDYEKNIKPPSSYQCNSIMMKYWRCTICGLSYEMRIRTKNANMRMNHISCPHCSLLSIHNPEIYTQIDYEKNEKANINVHKLTYYSSMKAYWKCPSCGGSWFVRVCDRVRYDTSCPYCCNQKVLKGMNDLLTLYPDIAFEWDYDLNDDTPSDYTAYSNRKKYWKCHVCNGSWLASINDRHNYGCPYCAGQKVLSGFNDLQSNYSDLVNNEWDWSRNSKMGLRPDEIASYGNAKAWWRCSQYNSHSWFASVKSRTRMKTGCPYCSLGGVSKQECMLADELCNLLPDFADEIRSNRNRRMLRITDEDGNVIGSASRLKEIDILMPSCGIAIEYNGKYWHNDDMIRKRFNNANLTSSEYDDLKRIACSKLGYELIIVNEDDYMNASTHDYIMHDIIIMS